MNGSVSSSWARLVQLAFLLFGSSTNAFLPQPQLRTGRQCSSSNGSSSSINQHQYNKRSTVVLVKATTTTDKVETTDQEWKEALPADAYYVLREAGTEPPGSSSLNQVKDPGTFCCRGCGAPLFTTSTKFDSGTGWPSFYQPIDRQAIDLKLDYKLLLPRTEVTCASCDGHLGHVFEDGPDPTGQRYCMNGVAMEFRSDEDNPELASTVAIRSAKAPFRPSAGSQMPSILFNGAVGVLFFASFVNRMGYIESTGLSLSVLDLFPVLPAVFYGVQSIRGISRLVGGANEPDDER